MLILRWHVFPKCRLLPRKKAAAMPGDNLSFVKDLNHLEVYSSFDLLPGVLERHAIAMIPHENMMVLSDDEFGVPFSVAITSFRQWFELGFINLFVAALPGSWTLLKGAVIHYLQPLMDRTIQRGQIEKFMIPERCYNLSLNHLSPE